VHPFFWGCFGGFRGDSLLSDQKHMRRRAQGMGISLLRGPVGELGRVFVCRDYVSSGAGHLSPWEPRRPLGVGSVHQEVVEWGLRASLSMGAL
jgi:hypothetical protein